MAVRGHLPNWTSKNAMLRGLWRNFSSEKLSAGKTASFNKVKVHRSDDNLKNRILKLVLPRRSATNVLQNYVDEGHRVSVSELRRISRMLLSLRRFKHALEMYVKAKKLNDYVKKQKDSMEKKNVWFICKCRKAHNDQQDETSGVTITVPSRMEEISYASPSILNWMEDNDRTRMLAADSAMRLELMIETHNLEDAEEYFENLPNTVSKKAACLPLLHSYVKEMATKKAEAFMLKMNGLGLIVSPHPFNEMMKLYMATSEQEKVLSVIQQMKQNQIPRTVLSYNLWMNACAELSGPASAEMVYKEMINDKTVAVGWSSFSTLACIYQKSGLIDKAFWALRQAEKKLSTSNRLGYLFLLTIYASLNSKGEVLRLWKVSEGVGGRITCANYMCILSCLVKLRETKEAEKIFLEWESQCRTYDIRVPNILLGAYSRNGSMKKAESLLVRALDRGGLPNFKTWEILMEGLVRNHEMNEVIVAMTRILG